MINYFKQLLNTLKSIDQKLSSIEKSTSKLSGCVHKSYRGYGASSSISTKHWND